MTRGLSSKSEIKEEIVKINDKVAIKYKVVEENINLEALRKEKENLENQLKVEEPSEQELIIYGRTIHPYYAFDRESAISRINEINKILENLE